jgi:thiosulfate/3-mercaptopyruvate sulfurtransferase
MGRSEYSFIKIIHPVRSIVAGMVMINLVLAILNLNLIINPVNAGTETGEFCCTCPDYANFDAWLAKKSQICDNSGNIITQTARPTNGGKATTVSLPMIYPKLQLITSAGSKLDGMVIIDVRSPEEYAKGHLPGARNLYWADTQSKGILDPVLMENALQKIGVKNSDSLLIYGGADDRASYIFWALSYLGHENLSKLDGGINEAVKAGQALDKSRL